jgi:hypothetical protein
MERTPEGVTILYRSGGTAWSPGAAPEGERFDCADLPGAEGLTFAEWVESFDSIYFGAMPEVTP